MAPPTCTPRRLRRLFASVGLVLLATACADGSSATSPDVSSTDAEAAADNEVDADSPPVSAQAAEGGARPHQSAGHDAALALVDVSMVTHTAASSGPWASPGTWSEGAEPGRGSRVHIPAGVTVTVDGVIPTEIETVRVDGTLRFAPDVDTALRVETLVTTRAGLLEIGTSSAPIAPEATASIVFVDDGPIDRASDPTLIGRGALLHGTTVVHGAEKRAFVAVATFPRTGDTSVRLAEAPSGWRPGDVVVVAGTDPNDPTTDEQRTIVAIDGDLVELDAPLALDHAAPQPDLEVHVANLTRNVRFSSQNTDIGRRGHVMVMHTNAASIDFAWFDGLGRSDKAAGYDDLEFIDLNPFIPARTLGGDNVRGRYSLHFHRGGTERDSAPARVNGSVVSNDPGWAFVNHSSHVDFTNNVAHDIVGAAYYTEAGDEIGSFIGNIAIRIVNPDMPLKAGIDGEEVDPDAREHRQDYGFQGDGMWLHSPNVRVENNVFSGTSGHAVIVWPEGLLERNPDGSTSKVFHDTANVVGGELIGPDGTRMQIMDVPFGSFTGNQAYSVTRGVQLFYLHTEFFGAELHHEDCTIDPPAAYDAQLRSTFTDSTIWNVDQVGFAAPYTNRITIDGLTLIGTGGDTIGIDVGHFMNERGIQITDARVDGFGTGIRVNAVGEVSLSGNRLSNQTDTQYVIPDEDGAGRVVDGPRTPDVEEPARDNAHLGSCVPGQPPADMDLDAIERGEFDDEDIEDDEFHDDEDDRGRHDEDDRGRVRRRRGHFDEEAASADVRLLAIGDSVLDFSDERSTPQAVGAALESQGVSALVVNRAIGGSCLRNCGAPDDRIPARYVTGDWTHVLVSGGGNDLGEFEDSCSSPDELISPDLRTGAMVELIDRIPTDVEVLLYRYSAAVADDSFCPEIWTLMDRYAAFAAERPNVTLVDATAVSGPDTPELWADEVHPNEEGSQRIGAMIAELILATNDS